MSNKAWDSPCLDVHLNTFNERANLPNLKKINKKVCLHEKNSNKASN